MLSSAARGELITFGFSGTVTSVRLDQFSWPSGFNGPKVGDPFTGFYTFDSNAPDKADPPDAGAFTSVLPDTAIGISIGELKLSGRAVSISTFDNYYEAGDWIPSIEVISNTSLARILDRNQVSLVIRHDNLFSDPNLLPLTPPSLVGASSIVTLEMFNSADLSGVPFVAIQGSLNSLTVVPEPSAFIGMGAAGLVWLVGRKRRRATIRTRRDRWPPRDNVGDRAAAC